MTSGKVVTTVGYERRFNPALKFDELDAFVEHMLRDQPPRPANMANIVEINRGLRPLTMDEPRARAISTAELNERLAAGCLLLDARPHEEFAGSHVPGAYGIEQSSRSFEQLVGWVLPPDVPIALIADGAENATTALRKLAFVGLDSRVEGFVEMRDWEAAGLPVTRVPLMPAKELARLLDEGDVEVIDVREPDEWAAGHIETARNLSVRLLPREVDSLPVSRDREIAIVCAAGMRSIAACSLLRRHGYDRVVNLAGGMAAWEREGLPVAR